METALGPLCGPEDVVAPMESNASSTVPRNFHENTSLGRFDARSRLLRKFLNRHSPLLGKWFYEHMPASRVRALVGEEVWNSYHKFCFERNPWAKVVSYYNWKRIGQGRRMPDFREYVLEKTHRLPLDARLYFEGERVLVDEVLDFKDFNESFTALCRRLGVPYCGQMPREKTDMTTQPVDFHDFYDEETKAKIAEVFAREIKLMNYQY